MDTTLLERLIHDDAIEQFEARFESLLGKRDSWPSPSWQADLLAVAIENKRYRHIDFLAGKGIYDQPTALGDYPANRMFLRLDPKSIQILFTHGWKPNQVTNPKLGNTLLHQIARFGTEDEARILLKLGCNVEKKNNIGETAIDVSTKFGNNGVTDFLRLSESHVLADKKLSNDEEQYPLFDLT